MHGSIFFVFINLLDRSFNYGFCIGSPVRFVSFRPWSTDICHLLLCRFPCVLSIVFSHVSKNEVRDSSAAFQYNLNACRPFPASRRARGAFVQRECSALRPALYPGWPWGETFLFDCHVKKWFPIISLWFSASCVVQDSLLFQSFGSLIQLRVLYWFPCSFCISSPLL